MRKKSSLSSVIELLGVLGNLSRVPGLVAQWCEKYPYEQLLVLANDEGPATPMIVYVCDEHQLRHHPCVLLDLLLLFGDGCLGLALRARLKLDTRWRSNRSG
eukprot:symbB.v1.2.035163.t2/scaffold4676.1/size42122/2